MFSHRLPINFVEMNLNDLHTSCLLVVDAQRGFTSLCEAELPVPGGLEIVPNVNGLLELSWARIDASQDWHPPDHCSFLGRRDNLYPPHCVQGTPGADFSARPAYRALPRDLAQGIRSRFRGVCVDGAASGLPRHAARGGITTVAVCGIATNICCFFVARDLRAAGFRVLLVEDASAGMDVPAANLFQQQTKEEGRRLGIEYTTVDAIRSARR